MRNKGRGAISWLTRPGRVVLERRRYTRGDGSSVTPMDALIDQAGQLVSLGVRQLVCRLALDAHSFERAAGNLQAAAQLALSVETLRKLVEDEGKRVIQGQNHEQLAFDWQARDCLTAGSGGTPVSRAYLSCDGVMVPVVTQAEKDKRRARAVERRRALRQARRDQAPAPPPLRPLAPAGKGAEQQYKEFKIVTIYDQAREHRAVRGTRQDHRHAGRLMRRLAGAVGLRHAQEKAGLGDGAVWLDRQVQRNVPELDTWSLDFQHLRDHVGQVQAAVFGAQDATGQAWMGQVLHTVKHEGYQPFWEGLMALRAKTRSAGKRRALDELLYYVKQRQHMINYPEHLRRGWDIGSGPMESMCKALTGRLKGRGMRWNPENAEALMALESLVQSNQWQQWWAKRAA